MQANSRGDRVLRRSVLCAVVALAFVALCAASALAASSVTVRGQAQASAKLSKSVKLPSGRRSTTTFTLRRSGTDIRGYATSKTVFYERGPNDSGYHKVTLATAHTAFKNWGGTGSCPATFVYRSYRSHGKTYRELSRVSYWMQGE